MPLVDSEGKNVVCDKCSLHLIGFIDSMGTSIHSDKSSKGIIMALGNIGRFLDISIINTYLSIDGGSTF